MTKVAKLPRDEQVGAFWNVCSQDLLKKIHHAIGIPPDTPLTLQEVITTIQNYLKAQRNIVVDRNELMLLRQGEAETFDDYLVKLRELAEDADLEHMQENEWLSTLIICGIYDEDTRSELLSKDPAATLDETIKLCRDNEKGERDTKSLRKRRSEKPSLSRRRADAALAEAVEEMAVEERTSKINAKRQWRTHRRLLATIAVDHSRILMLILAKPGMPFAITVNVKAILRKNVVNPKTRRTLVGRCRDLSTFPA